MAAFVFVHQNLSNRYLPIVRFHKRNMFRDRLIIVVCVWHLFGFIFGFLQRKFTAIIRI